MTAVTTRPTHHAHRDRVLDLYRELVEDYLTQAVASRKAERCGQLELSDTYRAQADAVLDALAARTNLSAAQIRGHLHQQVNDLAKPQRTLLYRLTHL